MFSLLFVRLSVKMFTTIIFNLLLLISPNYSFRLNNFKYIMQEMRSSVLLSGSIKYKPLWLEQKLDHFDENNSCKWKMRYFERLDLWKHAGPIYVFIGGESTLYPYSLMSGLAYELALETHGALYATEHRYYGESIPVNGTKAKDFKYLSAKQALADNAHLIRKIKLNPIFQKSKVVVIGGSYAGNLAAWMRLMYPELVDAALSSSAPVLAKKDFYEFLEKVSDVYYRYGIRGCWDSIINRFMWYDILLKTKEGIEKFKEDDNICPENNMSIPEKKIKFFQHKIRAFSGLVQYGDTYAIQRHCLNFNTIKEALQLGECTFWNETRKCHDYDSNNGDLNFEDLRNQRSWTYQTCNEFGYFQSTSSDRQPFTKNVPIEYYVQNCINTFGPEFNNTRIEKGINNVNKMYGGLMPNVTNVVFVNGEIDPWSRLGILNDLSYNAPAIIIPRASHARDLYQSQDHDEPELKRARMIIKNWIKKWIGAAGFVNKQ